jgi:hypothetical protein
MRHLVKALAGSSLLLLSLTTTNAQQYPPRGDTRYQDRDDTYRRGRLFDRIRVDLDRAEASALPFTGDRMRIERAKQEMNEYQRSLDAGNYSDRRPLDDAVRALQRVLDANTLLSDRNRDVLTEDLSRLHDWQARYDNFER